MDRKRHHGTEFKREAVRLARESDRPITEVAKELNIGRTTLYGWMMENEEDKRRARLSSESPEEELKRLRRENKTLKMECVYRQTFQTRKEARQVIFDYIEVYYNQKRRHSYLGYVSPAAYEKAFLAA